MTDDRVSAVEGLALISRETRSVLDVLTLSQMAGDGRTG